MDVATGCTRSAVSRADVHVRSEGRKAPAVGTSMEFGAIFRVNFLAL